MKKISPLILVDVAIFTLQDQRLNILLARRTNEPAKGQWALPGGILRLELDDSLDDTARRVLGAKTGIKMPYLEQVITVSGPTRDPRGWSLSTLYYALLPSDQAKAVAGDKIDAVEWCNARDPKRRLAFDHAKLVRAAVERLHDKVAGGALPLHLLPEKFTLTELQKACEAILGKTLEKSAFRRLLRVTDNPSLKALSGEFQLGKQRPAQLYGATARFAFEKRAS